jgi:hypothetical protein
MKCTFKNGCFYFDSEGFKYLVYMKNERGEFQTPKEDIINFHMLFLNKKHCKLSFDDEQSISYNLDNIVQFETLGTIMNIHYDLCKDAIIEYLNKL